MTLTRQAWIRETNREIKNLEARRDDIVSKLQKVECDDPVWDLLVRKRMNLMNAIYDRKRRLKRLKYGLNMTEKHRLYLDQTEATVVRSRA